MLNQNNLSTTSSREESFPPELPNDIWIEIAGYLSPQDLANFKLACKAFLALKSTHLCLQNFTSNAHVLALNA